MLFDYAKHYSRKYVKISSPAALHSVHAFFTWNAKQIIIRTSQVWWTQTWNGLSGYPAHKLSFKNTNLGAYHMYLRGAHGSLRKRFLTNIYSKGLKDVLFSHTLAVMAEKVLVNKILNKVRNHDGIKVDWNDLYPFSSWINSAAPPWAFFLVSTDLTNKVVQCSLKMADNLWPVTLLAIRKLNYPRFSSCIQYKNLSSNSFSHPAEEKKVPLRTCTHLE